MGVRDASGGYGASMVRVVIDIRCNTSLGDLDAGATVDLPPVEAETLVERQRVAHYWNEPIGTASPAGAQRARGRRGVRGEQRGVQGDHTRTVTPS